VNITGVSSSIHNVQLVNAQGNIIKSWTNAEGSLNISDIKPGIYWMRALTKEGHIVEKLLIE